MLRADASVSVWEWKIPLLLFLVGLGVLLAGSFTVGNAASPAYALLAIGLYLVIYVPLTVAAMYVAAALLSVSFGFLRTALLKLAALTLFTLSLNQVGEWLGYPVAAWLLSIAVTFFLLSYLFDLDARETVLSAVVISVVRFALGMAIVALLGALADRG